MDIILFVILICAISIILAIILILRGIKNRDKKLDIEIGKVPIYAENCAASLYFGSRFMTSFSIGRPMVRFSLYDEFIVVSFSHLGMDFLKDEKILLKFDEIDKVELAKKILWDPRGISIYYHKGNVPDYMIVWLKDWKKVKELIESKINN